MYRGKPTVLVTSGEHYGAVLNGKFDFRKYLDTLVPELSDFVSPFARDASGVYDLTAWNAAYFSRLREFMAEADKRGIVVEICLTTTHYNETHWKLTPWQNNRNGIGAGLKHTDPSTLLSASWRRNWRPSTTSILRFVMSPISAGQHSSGSGTWRE